MNKKLHRIFSFYIFTLPKNVEQKKDDTLLRDNMNKPSEKPANTSFPTAPQK